MEGFQMLWVIGAVVLGWAAYLAYKEHTGQTETTTKEPVSSPAAESMKQTGKNLPVDMDIRSMIIAFLDIAMEINKKMPYASNNYINMYGGVKDGTGTMVARFDKDWGGTDSVLKEQLGYAITEKEPSGTETGWWIDGTNVCFKGYGMTGFDSWLKRNMDDANSVKYDLKALVESYFPGMRIVSMSANAYQGAVSSFLVIGK